MSSCIYLQKVSGEGSGGRPGCGLPIESGVLPPTYSVGHSGQFQGMQVEVELSRQEEDGDEAEGQEINKAAEGVDGKRRTSVGGNMLAAVVEGVMPTE